MTEYIEREALIEELEKLRMSETLSKHATYELCAITQDAISRAQIVVAGFPAADVAPVVHGRWLQTSKRVMYCSNCGTVCGIGAHIDEVTEDLDFCSSCGALMDGNGCGEPRDETKAEREAFDFLRRRFNRKE